MKEFLDIMLWLGWGCLASALLPRNGASEFGIAWLGLGVAGIAIGLAFIRGAKQ